MDRPLKLFSQASERIAFETDKQTSSIELRPENSSTPATIEINGSEGNRLKAPRHEKFRSFHEILGPVLAGCPSVFRAALAQLKFALFSWTILWQPSHRGRFGSRFSQPELQVVFFEDNLCSSVHSRRGTRSLPYGVERIRKRFRYPRRR